MVAKFTKLKLGPDVDRLLPPTMSTPRVELGAVVPYVIGTVRISNPIVTYKGGTTVKVVSLGVGTYALRVQFRTDFQMVLAQGPGVRLRGVYDKTRKLWEGVAGSARADIGLEIHRPEMDINGLIFYGGDIDQAPEPAMLSVLPDDPIYTRPRVPSYAGFAYVFIKGADRENDYTGFTFEVDRFVNPLGLPDAVNVSSDGKDVNPMTLMIDFLCSRWNSCGYTIAQFDVAQLTAVAMTLATEGNFASAVIEKGDMSTEDFIAAIETQTHGVFYEHPETGLMTFRLFRDDALAGVMSIDESVISRFTIAKQAWEGVTNRVKSSFVSRANNYTVTPIGVKTSFNASDDVDGETLIVNLPFVFNGDLASKIVSRALSIAAAPRIQADIEMGRVQRELLIGEPLRVTWRAANIVDVEFYVESFRDTPPDVNRLLLNVVQVPKLNLNVIFPTEELPYEVEPTPEPLPPKEAEIISVPFALAAASIYALRFKPGAGLTPAMYRDIESDLAVPMILARASNKYQSFWSVRNDLTSDPFQTEIARSLPYNLRGILVNSISRYDGFDDGRLPFIEVTLDFPYDLIGSASWTPSVTSVDPLRVFGRITQDKRLLIGEEFFTFVGDVTYDENSKIVRINDVYRSLYDTVALDHPAGQPLWAWRRDFSNNLYQYRSSELSKIFNSDEIDQHWDLFGSIDGAVYSQNWLDVSWKPSRRQVLPPRPQDVRIDGQRKQAPHVLMRNSEYEITWKQRSRFTFPLENYLINNPQMLRDRAIDYPAGIMAQKSISQASEWDFTNNNYATVKVMLEDVDGVQHVIGSVTAFKPEALTVTIPAGAAPGPGRLWVSNNIALGSSDEFAIDWLPVGIDTAGVVPGYGRLYGIGYGGV